MQLSVMNVRHVYSKICCDIIIEYINQLEKPVQLREKKITREAVLNMNGRFHALATKFQGL